MKKDIHYQYWLLLIPYYNEKWLQGISYEALLKEYKTNENNSGNTTRNKSSYSS